MMKIVWFSIIGFVVFMVICVSIYPYDSKKTSTREKFTATIVSKKNSTYDFVVKNRTFRSVTVTYPYESLQYSYSLFDDKKNIVYSYGFGDVTHSLTPSVGTRVIKPLERIHHTIDLSQIDLPKGTYTLKANPEFGNRKPEATLIFTVPTKKEE